MIRTKYFWPGLCCLLLVMVCYLGSRVETQQMDLDNAKFDLHLEQVKSHSYDSMLTDCQAAISDTTKSLEKMNANINEATK